MVKRQSMWLLLILLLGGFFWYYHSQNLSATTAFYSMSFTNQDRYSDNMVEFVYPANWQVDQQQVDGDEILHHVNYREPEKQVMGYVQVWAALSPLPEFLRESRDSSAAKADIKNFSMKQLQADQYQGYLLAYERNGSQNSFVAREYFFEKDKRIYRISLFVGKESWGNYYQEIFDQLVASFTIK